MNTNVPLISLNPIYHLPNTLNRKSYGLQFHPVDNTPPKNPNISTNLTIKTIKTRIIQCVFYSDTKPIPVFLHILALAALKKVLIYFYRKYAKIQFFLPKIIKQLCIDTIHKQSFIIGIPFVRF